MGMHRPQSGTYDHACQIDNINGFHIEAQKDGTFKLFRTQQIKNGYFWKSIRTEQIGEGYKTASQAKKEVEKIINA